MTDVVYDVDYFIKKFEAIPEEKWIVGAYWSKEDPTKKCALGHCGVHYKNNDSPPVEAMALCDIFGGLGAVVPVNDGLGIYASFGTTPRVRILRHLKEIQENG